MQSDGGDGGTVVVGVISDTHGRLYPRVVESLQGVAHIIHAGDVGSPRVLEGLRAIAPVTAVRGNCDLEAWAAVLPAEARMELAGVRILVRHIAGRGGGTTAAGARVMVSGHTHSMRSEERDGVLYLDPGSAGPERFGHARSLALLAITPARAGGPAQVSVEFVLVPET